MANEFNTQTGKERLPEAPPPAAPRTDAVDFSRRVFEAYRSSASTFLSEAAKNVELKHNQPFTEAQAASIKSKGLAPVAVAHLHRILRQYIAMIAAKPPRPSATAREDSDTKTAALFADLFEYAWDISSAQRSLRKVLEDDFVVGVGYFYVYFDAEASQGDGDIKITTLPYDCVYQDTNSRDPLCRDGAHTIVSFLMTREQAEMRWPGKAAQIRRARPDEDEQFYTSRYAGEGQQHRADLTDAFHRRYRYICRYSRVMRHRWRIEETVPGQFARRRLLDEDAYRRYRAERAFALRGEETDQFVTLEDEVAQMEAAYSAAGGDGTEAVLLPQQDPQTGQTTLVTLLPITRGDLVDMGFIEARQIRTPRYQVTESLGDVELSHYELETEHCPVVPLMSEHDGTPYPTSDAAKVRPLIEEYNKKQQIIIQHASSIAGTTWWAQEGSVGDEVEEQLANPKAKILFFRGDQPPAMEQKQQLPSEFYLNQDRIKSDINEIVGLYPFQQGDPSQAPNTYRGQLDVNEKAQARIEVKAKALYETLDQVARVYADFVPVYYTRPRLERIVQPSGPPKEIAINQPVYDDFGQVIDLAFDVTAARVDIKMVPGSTFASSRWAELEFYRTLLDHPVLGPAILPEFVKRLDTPDWEKILERADAIPKLQQALEEALERIKELEGDMQTASRRLIEANEREAVQKTEGRLARVEEGAKKEAELFRQRLGDELSARKALADRIDQLFQTPNAEA